VDPIKDGVNWYVYVNADPVNFVDAWGLLAAPPGDGTAEMPNPWEQSLSFQAVADDMAEALVQADPYAHMQAGKVYSPAVGTAYVFPMDSEENPKPASAAYGNTVVIVHDNGYVSGLAHLEAFSVEDGEEVEQGQEIGTMGASTTHPDLVSLPMQPHLHWGVKENVSQATSRTYWSDSYFWDSGTDLQTRIELESKDPDSRQATGGFGDPLTVVESGEMIHPANTGVSSYFGPRTNPPGFTTHYGVDYRPTGVER